MGTFCQINRLFRLIALQNSPPALRPQILKLALDYAIGDLDGQKSP
jgi:hypothetical protein